jgi:ankyrin repeat protein
MAPNFGPTALQLAAQNGHLAVVQCLVAELIPDVHQASRSGFTPLMVAAQNGHLDVVQCLVEVYGADVKNNW